MCKSCLQTHCKPSCVPLFANLFQKNVGNPNHHYFPKKYRNSHFYCNTPPICIAVPLVPLRSEERESCQYSSHLYRSTPPICIAIRLPFVSQYFWGNLGGCGHRDVPHFCLKLTGFMSESTSFKVLPVQSPCLNTPSRFNTPTRISLPLFQGEIIYAPPPLPHFWPKGIFQGRGVGVYILRPHTAGILYAPPFYTPPTPRRVFSGVGGVGVYKNRPRIYFANLYLIAFPVDKTFSGVFFLRALLCLKTLYSQRYLQWVLFL